MADCVCKYWSWKGEPDHFTAVHHPYCDGTGKNVHESYLSSFVEWDGMEGEMTKSEPELSLLVIDLGDSCVVKVEKGDGTKVIGSMCGLGRSGHDDTYIVYVPFSAMKAELDALEDKPVPRIERAPYGSQSEYQLILADDTMLVCPERSIGLTLDDVQGLTTFIRGTVLAGHDLPIYEPKTGHWEPLTVLDWTDAAIEAAKAGYGIDKHSFERAIVPFKAWRYTR